MGPRRRSWTCLRQWFAETGAAPRRNDWSGERPEAAGQHQRKWMREHPRWPSSSCVAGHFGSWSAALAAAALPARRLTFDSSVSERVADARRLAAAGLSARRTAALLGVSVSSVHNYLRARSCPECGGPVTNPTASRCASVCRPGADGRPAMDPSRRPPGDPGVAGAAGSAPDLPGVDAVPPAARGGGRPRARGGRARRSSASCTAAVPTPGTPPCATPAPRSASRRWSDESVRSAMAGFWVQTGRATAVAGPRHRRRGRGRIR